MVQSSPVARDTFYVNASGDLVPFDALDEAERALYSTPPPWEVAEYGLNLVEYVCKWYADAAMHQTFFEDASLIPEAP